MDETRRHFLRQLAILGIAPTALAAFPPSSNAAYAAQPPAASEPNGPAKWTRSRPFNPPKIVRKPAELFAARLVLPFHKESIRRKRAPKRQAYVPGAWPGLAAFSGGEEAALINNPTGEWLCGGDPNNMLRWAEGHGALPNHWIDPGAGRLWSIVDHPKVSAYSRTATFDYVSTSPVKLDSAHYPAVCYVAYLATGDRYYLEELQVAANYHQLQQNPEYREDAKGLFTQGQARAYAWSLRDTVSAYLATPEGDVPKPLLPKSYWKRILDDNRDHFNDKWVKNGIDKSLTGCHFVPILNGGKIAPWQQDWIGAVIGWMVWTGRFNDWRENYEWQIKQAIDRTSGKSGYPRSRAIGYWLKTAEVTNMASFAAANHLTETPDGKFPPKTNMHYAESLRANLKIATLNGVPGAAECFAYVDKQVTTIDPKWAV